MTAEEITEQALELAYEEREQLAIDMIESLEGEQPEDDSEPNDDEDAGPHVLRHDQEAPPGYRFLRG